MLELILLGILSSFIYFRVQILSVIQINKLQKEIIFGLLILLTFYNFGITISSTLSVLIFIIILYKKKCIELSCLFWEEIVKFEKIIDNAIDNPSSVKEVVAKEVVAKEVVAKEVVAKEVVSIKSEDSVVKNSNTLKHKMKLAKKMSKIKKKMNTIMKKMTDELDNDSQLSDTE
jgi:hypothetical protein